MRESSIYIKMRDEGKEKTEGSVEVGSGGMLEWAVKVRQPMVFVSVAKGMRRNGENRLSTKAKEMGKYSGKKIEKMYKKWREKGRDCGGY